MSKWNKLLVLFVISIFKENIIVISEFLNNFSTRKFPYNHKFKTLNLISLNFMLNHPSQKFAAQLLILLARWNSVLKKFSVYTLKNPENDQTLKVVNFFFWKKFNQAFPMHKIFINKAFMLIEELYYRDLNSEKLSSSIIQSFIFREYVSENVQVKFTSRNLLSTSIPIKTSK